MRLLKKIRAVSPVVGVILMVAITIVLAATIYLWVSSLSSPTKSAPQINFAFAYDKGSGNLTLTVISAQGSVNWTKIKPQLYINGKYYTGTWHVTKYNGATTTLDQTYSEVHAGDVLWASLSGYNVTTGTQLKIQIIYTPSNSVIYTYTYTVP